MPAPVFDPAAALAIASDDVELAVGASQVGATITHPTRAARYPGIVVIAGSGPTDRDWNNPLIKSRNGSGKLLGDALAAHGAVVLRFDKPGVGKNTTPLADVSADTYHDEALAALDTLRARADVDPQKLFVAGHSEGGIHAIRTALAAQPRIAGVIILSGPGRSMADVMYSQVEKQMREAAAAGAIPAQMADAELASLRRALDDLVAGRPVDPAKASTIPQLQQLVALFVSPANEKFSRSIVGVDPSALVGQIAVPVFVFNGKKDIQVDPELDAKRLDKALNDAHATSRCSSRRKRITCSSTSRGRSRRSARTWSRRRTITTRRPARSMRRPSMRS
jgi:pimeloyl-ACP methyl ester carboxylesterase